MPKLATHNELNDQGSVDREFDNIYRQLNVSSSSTSYPTISSGAGAPASTPTKVGDIYLDTTAKREYRAYGTSSSADWLKIPVYYSGTVTVTGGGGDVTVTLPWDWSGGYLEIIRSDSTGQWVEPSTANSLQLQTSYDALTNANYTTGHVMTHSKSTTADNCHSGTTKTDNFSGLPKSATSNTFVLDDGGTTTYVKYFVWA